MNTDSQHLEILWLRKDLPRSVDRYFDAHQGEFSLGRIKSQYPYNGSAWKKFRELPEINTYEGYHRFEEVGNSGCWEPIHDKIRNNRTADLLAAADLLRGRSEAAGTHGQPGGIGLDTGEVWAGLLDGGVGVEVHVGQDEYTNAPEGWQRTTIRGPLVFRCLLELLGFDWIEKKITGEETAPSHAEVRKLVKERLVQNRT